MRKPERGGKPRVLLFPGLRGSKLGVFLRCRQSCTQRAHDDTGNRALLGRAIHDYAECERSGLDLDAEALANLYGVNVSEVSALVTAYYKLRSRVIDELGLFDESTEVELRWQTIDKLIGHADLVGKVELDGERWGLIFDYKTGESIGGQHQYQDPGQAVAYAVPVGADPSLAGVRVMFGYVRHEELVTYDFPRRTLDHLRDMVTARYYDAEPPAYEVGPWCVWCPRRNVCPERLELQKVWIKRLSGLDVENLREMPEPDLIQVYRTAKELGNLAEKVRSAVREIAEERGGLEGEDMRLVLTQVERVNINPREAWATLHQQFGDDLFRAVTLKKGRLEDLVRSGAARGGKGKAVDWLMHRLNVIDATRTSRYTRLREEQKEAKL